VGGGKEEGESGLDPAELARLRDARERDEFAQRLATRDEDRQKAKRAERAAAADMVMTSSGVRMSKDDFAAAVPELRKESRRAYLEMRTDKELKLLAEAVRYDEELQARTRVTEEERRRLELNKQLLQLATAKAAMDAEVTRDDDRYRMPDLMESEDGRPDLKKRSAVLNARYTEDRASGGAGGGGEHAAWERSRLSAATTKYGAADAAGRVVLRQRRVKRLERGVDGIMREVEVVVEEEDPAFKRYDFIVDDAIDFVGQEAGLAGTGLPDTDPSSTTAATGGSGGGSGGYVSERDKLAEVRRSLPVYAYRDELLAAIAENQVLIVVGETGSGKTTQVSLLHGRPGTQGGIHPAPLFTTHRHIHPFHPPPRPFISLRRLGRSPNTCTRWATRSWARSGARNHGGWRR